MANVEDSIQICPGDLILKENLEHGSFGRVQVCYHKTLGQVVLKTVYIGPPKNGENRKRLLEEGMRVHSLNHDRVIRLLGVILEAGTYFLVMELIPKDNLLTALKTVTLPDSIKGRIVLEILEGMSYLAENKAIHRDLKPENVLVTKDYHIKIADVAMSSCQAWARLIMDDSRRQAQRAASSSSTGSLDRSVGHSLCYLAPEHLESINAPSTEKSAVYSFAIVVWVILTGEEPFKHIRNQEHMFRCVCKGERPDVTLIRPNTPYEFVKLMRACWHSETNLRPTFSESYKSFQAFYDKELEKYIEKDLEQIMNSHDGLVYVTGKTNSLCLGSSSVQTGFSAPLEDMNFHKAGEAHSSIEADAFPSGFDLGPKPHHDRGGHKRSSYVGLTDSCPQNSALKLDGASSRSSTHYRSSEALAASSVDPSWQGAVTERPVWARSRASPQFQRTQSHRPQFQRNQSFPGLSTYEAPGVPVSSEANSSSTMRRQDSGVIIQNANWIQIGDNNQIYIGSGELNLRGFEASSSVCSILREFLEKYGDCRVTEEHLNVLRQNIGSNWKHCGRRLGLSDHDLDSISHDFARDGLQEMVHQMLKCWRMKESLVSSTVGQLCQALRDQVKEELLIQLLCMNNGKL